jgi:pimeloyl-ACP methyl ester carboxylesterase
VAALAAAHAPRTPGTARVFGGSYGTVWLQRTVQAAPALFNGAYMEAAGDLGMNFERIGAWFDAAGQALLLRCDADAACAARFPDGAVAAAAEVHADALAGTGCAGTLGVGLTELQRLFSRLLQGTTERLWVAPLLYRLQRCSADDQRALRVALATPSAGPPTSPRFNALLNWAGIYRGLYHVTLSPAELDALTTEGLFDNGGMAALARRRALFPEDFDDRSPAGDLASYTGPVHIVQGALDPLTPALLVPAITARWSGADVHTLVLPDGGHTSPRFTLRPDGERCTMRWLAGFVVDPSAPFDLSCLDDVPTLDLGVTLPASQELSEAFWGVRDPWDG